MDDEHLDDHTALFDGAEHSMIDRGKTVLVVDAAEATRQMLGAIPPRSDLPIVMMAWNVDPKGVLAVQGLKLDGLLVKPVSGAVLEKKIASASAPRATAAPRRFSGQAS